MDYFRRPWFYCLEWKYFYDIEIEIFIENIRVINSIYYVPFSSRGETFREQIIKQRLRINMWKPQKSTVTSH